MARVVTFADFRPSPRADGEAWTKARIEETDDPAGEWKEVDVLDLDPVDADPAEPDLRSFTATVKEDWARIVFVDALDGEDAPSPMVFVPGPPFRPTVAQVSAILRARTYSSKGNDEDPMSVLVGAELKGTFGAETRPTAEQAEADIIPQACVDTLRATGQAPGFLLDDQRRVAGLKAATEIERSYTPEQTDPADSIYQTLRMTYDEEAAKLRRALQWLVLEGSMEQ
jgi:hypothetical protein